MKIAVYQMEPVAGSPVDNREKVRNWVKHISQVDNPDLILLPEMWTTSYVLDRLDDLAEDEGRTTKKFLRDLAKQFEIAIIGGSIANRVGDEIYNTSFVFDQKGELIYEYSKIHLVPMLNEHQYLTGGNDKVKTFEINGVKMGLIICYDLRFPELARKLALEGAQVLFIPAEWPIERTSHWVNLQLARAIENQMYVISAGTIGTVGDVTYSGKSLIVDPWGDKLSEGKVEEEDTMIENLDFNKVKEVRKAVPIFEGRVERLY